MTCLQQVLKGIKIDTGRKGKEPRFCLPIMHASNFLQVKSIVHTKLVSLSLFNGEDKSPQTKTKFVDEVRSTLTNAGLPAKEFAGHSFQIGAATTAATAGIQDSAI